MSTETAAIRTQPIKYRIGGLPMLNFDALLSHEGQGHSSLHKFAPELWRSNLAENFVVFEALQAL
ncbi:hypothetical protein [Alicyclobacillus ferrooxydans]|uniref:Uncharacterized protein n=1 Tax=Alicyclobacillus ferrooxydans TaxID=471514 RepID=A0A0P9CAD0_9BACL|nr:hypothetical protein [Alicyclobacillus ferrooxydans]KPV42314.1 hypothetical protein AN477_18630 [Alicyclobacillus ferrooxydans]